MRQQSSGDRPVSGSFRKDPDHVTVFQNLLGLNQRFMGIPFAVDRDHVHRPIDRAENGIGQFSFCQIAYDPRRRGDDEGRIGQMAMVGCQDHRTGCRDVFLSFKSRAEKQPGDRLEDADDGMIDPCVLFLFTHMLSVIFYHTDFAAESVMIVS